MTRALRKRHRIIAVALALVVPALFIAAMAARRSVPTQKFPVTIPANINSR